MLEAFGSAAVVKKLFCFERESIFLDSQKIL